MLTTLALLGAAPDDPCANLRSAATPTLEIVSTAREGNVCRVEAIARPRPNARIAISLWLPSAERWSGRYYQMGNGGFAGTIDRATLAAAAARGDAAAATDTGHVGTGFDASWARGRPDLVEDYAWRSIKVTADAATALIARYYDRAARRRYFMGCSFGGRQALVAASRWPSDWDGIIAGAPAIDWVDWLGAFAYVQHRLRFAKGGWLPPARLGDWITVARSGHGSAAASLAKACRRGTRAACLTPSEASSVTTLETIGFTLAEADPGEWTRWILNPDPNEPSQARLAREAFRYVFADRPEWTLADYAAGAGAPGNVRATFEVGRLDPFLERGGKLITYIGLADAVLPAAKIIAALQARLPDARLRQRGYRQLVLPGMAHCQGGPQAHAFGQSLTAPPAGGSAGDIRTLLEDWVEKGPYPVSIVTGLSGAVGSQNVAFTTH